MDRWIDGWKKRERERERAGCSFSDSREESAESGHIIANRGEKI